MAYVCVSLCKPKSFIYLKIFLDIRSPDESHVTFDVDSFTKALVRILGEIASLFLLSEYLMVIWLSWVIHPSPMVAVLICLLSVLTQNNIYVGADSEELDSDGLDEEEEFDFSNKDDEDLDVEDQRQDQKVPPNELIGSLKSYMSEMDRELAHTNVGKSFTVQKRGASSVNATTSQSAGPDSGAEDTELTEIKKAQTIGLKPKLTSE
ncbi:protein ecdysoneless homolog isoform X1 [Tyto alba]|nr:protein ecdysoneless homolog isoform X1 [Tyto alba]